VTERERVISTAYEAFRRVRKLPAAELCLVVVDLALRASGADPLSPDERRLVDAYIRCTWDAWPGTAAAVQGRPDASEWPGWPAGASTVPASTTGLPARCTLFD
jgi:hypothetical protein